MDKDGSLRGLFKSHMKAPHWTPIETSATVTGTPDLEGCLDGIQIWVELKKTEGWTVEIRPSQRGWALRRVGVGGRVWVAVRQLGKARDSLWLISGAFVREVGEYGLKANIPKLVFDGGSQNWPWPVIQETLFRGTV